MLKKLGLFTLLGFSLTADAQQINNGGLEHWTTNSGTTVPDSFYTSDVLIDLGTVTASTDAHSGTSSALLETRHDVLMGTDVPAKLAYSNTAMFLPKSWAFTGRPSKLRFWYKFSKQGNDTSVVSIVLKKWNAPPLSTPVGYATLNITSNANTWTMAEMSLFYAQAYNPDSMDLVFSNARFTYHLGTKLWIDDISLIYTTGVEEPEQGRLVKFYPNPATGSFAVALPEREAFGIRIVDMAGKLIYEAASLKGQASIDCRNWARGMYLVHVTTETKTYSEKLYLNQ